jgi:hypothetical protein
VDRWILLKGYQVEIVFLMCISTYLSETEKLNIIYAGIDELNSAVCLLIRK